MPGNRLNFSKTKQLPPTVGLSAVTCICRRDARRLIIDPRNFIV